MGGVGMWKIKCPFDEVFWNSSFLKYRTCAARNPRTGVATFLGQERVVSHSGVGTSYIKGIGKHRKYVLVLVHVFVSVSVLVLALVLSWWLALAFVLASVLASVLALVLALAFVLVASVRSGSIWDHLVLVASGSILGHLAGYGSTLEHLAVWQHLGGQHLAAAWIIWQHLAAPGNIWKQLAAAGRIWVNVCPASLHTSIKRERHWKYECLRAHFETACQNRIACGDICEKNTPICEKNTLILKSVFKINLLAGTFWNRLSESHCLRGHFWT